MRHVGLNMVFLVPGETGGMEIAARSLAAALTRVAPSLRVTAFVPREAADMEFPVERVVVPVRSRSRPEWVRGEQALLPGFARRAGCELVHSLASTAPARGRFARVVTIHDLHYVVAPDAHFGVRRLGMRVLIPLAARRSHRIIVDSDETRAQLMGRLGVHAGKIDVVPLGAGRTAEGRVTPERELRTRLALGPRHVVLSLSAKRPHKNLAGLLEALALLPAERRPVLVLPGYRTSRENDLRRRAVQLGITDDVRFEGWLPPADIEGLFALAACLVAPSFHEGFGLPVLEAMARGVPVACSDRQPLAGLAEGAALVFDPLQPAQIAAALELLLFGQEDVARLIAAGRNRAASFTWERAAELTLATYDRAVAAARSPAAP